MDTPYLRVEDTGSVFELRTEVTTVGRGEGVDIALDDPSVSRLHAEIVRRGRLPWGARNRATPPQRRPQAITRSRRR